VLTSSLSYSLTEVTSPPFITYLAICICFVICWSPSSSINFFCRIQLNWYPQSTLSGQPEAQEEMDDPKSMVLTCHNLDWHNSNWCISHLQLS
jgi:hypothetical protein